jgi:hypothetical protein
MSPVNVEERKPHGVGGWLQVLCRMLILWHPLIYGLTSASAFNAIAVRGRSVALVLIVRLLVVAFGVAAGMGLQSGRFGAVRFAITSLVLSAAMDVFAYTSSYFPSNRMPGETPLYVAGSLAYYGAWIAYLTRSKRVRNTFS